MASQSTGICDPDDVHSPVALLLIDVINALDFDGAEALLKNALPMAERIQRLKEGALKHNVPVIYVNDNFGRWRSDFRTQVESCLKPDVLGRPIAERLKPEDDDFFVLKPMSSGFYSTPLELLLNRLKARTVVLAGMATNLCVLFTANDAHMRGYRVIVPSDCSAAESESDHQVALDQMQKGMSADTRPSSKINWPELLAKNPT